MQVQLLTAHEGTSRAECSACCEAKRWHVHASLEALYQQAVNDDGVVLRLNIMEKCAVYLRSVQEPASLQEIILAATGKKQSGSTTVSMAVARLLAAGIIRQVYRGVYQWCPLPAYQEGEHSAS